MKAGRTTSQQLAGQPADKKLLGAAERVAAVPILLHSKDVVRAETVPDDVEQVPRGALLFVHLGREPDARRGREDRVLPRPGVGAGPVPEEQRGGHGALAQAEVAPRRREQHDVPQK